MQQVDREASAQEQCERVMVWTVIVRYWLAEFANMDIANDNNNNVDVEAADAVEAVSLALAVTPLTQHATALHIECFLR